MLKADGRRENVYDTLKKIDDEDLETYFNMALEEAPASTLRKKFRTSTIEQTKN